VLVKLGGSLSRVRDKVIELAPPGTGEGPELPSPLRRSRVPGPLDELMRRLEAMDERLSAIERHLGLAGGPGAPAAGPGPGASAGGPAEPGGGQEPGAKPEPGRGPRPDGGEDPGGAAAGGAGR
jgi:hypothetical protein